MVEAVMTVRVTAIALMLGIVNFCTRLGIKSEWVHCLER
jgi:hypothetical protein